MTPYMKVLIGRLQQPIIIILTILDPGVVPDPYEKITELLLKLPVKGAEFAVHVL